MGNSEFSEHSWDRRLRSRLVAQRKAVLQALIGVAPITLAQMSRRQASISELGVRTRGTGELKRKFARAKAYLV